MLDRRRAARFCALALAGLAVAGTSAPMPSHVTWQSDLHGTVRLTHDQPVAIQPIDVTLAGTVVDTLSFAAALGQLPNEGTVALSIEALGGGTSTPTRMAPGPTPQPALGAVTANATYGEPCSGSCPAAFGLVLTWIGAPAGGTVDVAWTLHATAQLRGTAASAGPSAAAIAAPAAARAPQSFALRSVSNGAAVHLTERNRYRAWTVELHRPTATVPAGQAGALTQARLTAAATQLVGQPFGGIAGTDHREDDRRDPPVQLRVSGDGYDWRWAGDGPLTFDPFASCARDGACDQTLTIELAWADGRPDTAYDAGWTLDLAAVADTGDVGTIEATVTSVPTAELAIAVARGSFEARDRTGRGQSEFVASGSLAGRTDPAWAQMGLPARAVATIRVVPLPGATLPADATFQVYAAATRVGTGPSLGTTAEVRVDEEVTLAFEPALVCGASQPGVCESRGIIGSGLASPGPNASAAELRYRVEWSLELGATVSGAFTIAVDPGAGPSASVRP